MKSLFCKGGTFLVLFFMSALVMAALPVKPTKICDKQTHPRLSYLMIAIEDVELFNHVRLTSTGVILPKGTIASGFRHEVKARNGKFYTSFGGKDCPSGVVESNKVVPISFDDFKAGIDQYNNPVKDGDVAQKKNLGLDELLKTNPLGDWYGHIPYDGRYDNNHTFYLAYVLTDTALYSNRGEKTPVNIRAGSVVELNYFKERHDVGFLAYTTRQIAGTSGAVISKKAVRLLDNMDIPKVLDAYFPTVNRKANSVEKVIVYNSPDTQNNNRPRYGVGDVPIGAEYEVLRKTQNSAWYVVRTWYDGRWRGGFAQARKFTIQPTVEEQARIDAENRRKEETERRKRAEEKARLEEALSIERARAEQKRLREEAAAAKRLAAELAAEQLRKERNRQSYLIAGLVYLIFFVGSFFFPAYRYFAQLQWMKYYDWLKALLGDRREFPALLLVSFLSLGFAIYLHLSGVHNLVFIIATLFALLAGAILLAAAIGSLWTAFLLPGLFVTLWENARFLMNVRSGVFDDLDEYATEEERMSNAEMRWREYKHDRAREYYDAREGAARAQERGAAYDKIRDMQNRQQPGGES